MIASSVRKTSGQHPVESRSEDLGDVVASRDEAQLNPSKRTKPRGSISSSRTIELSSSSSMPPHVVAVVDSYLMNVMLTRAIELSDVGGVNFSAGAKLDAELHENCGCGHGGVR